jgi:hypothetical protein
MGTYIYRIQTKARKLKTVGSAVGRSEINLLKYAGKVSSWSSEREEKINRMIMARLENVWEGRAAPDFYAMGYENGYNVYSNWLDGVIETEDTDAGMVFMCFEGYIKDEGKSPVFEKWFHMDIDVSDMAKYLGVSDLCNLSSQYRHRVYHAFGGTCMDYSKGGFLNVSHYRTGEYATRKSFVRLSGKTQADLNRAIEAIAMSDFVLKAPEQR